MTMDVKQCNRCGHMTKKEELKPYVIDGKIVWLCEDCEEKYKQCVIQADELFIKECDYL